MLKVDILDNRSITDAQADQISDHLRKMPVEAVVFSDFRHGIFNRRTIPGLTNAIPRGIFRVADSQVASRWGNILEFKGFDLLTPNEREARFSLADAQLVTARSYGFASWAKLKQHLAEIEPFVWNPPPLPDPESRVDVFLRLACLTYTGTHPSPPRARQS